MNDLWYMPELSKLLNSLNLQSIWQGTVLSEPASYFKEIVPEDK